jgi:hypothetical protein
MRAFGYGGQDATLRKTGTAEIMGNRPFLAKGVVAMISPVPVCVLVPDDFLVWAGWRTCRWWNCEGDLVKAHGNAYDSIRTALSAPSGTLY